MLFRSGDNDDPASPACSLHELARLGVDPSYLGYANRDELIALFNVALALAGCDNPQVSAALAQGVARLGGAVNPPPQARDRLTALGELRDSLPRMDDASLRSVMAQAIAQLDRRR